MNSNNPVMALVAFCLGTTAYGQVAQNAGRPYSMVQDGKVFRFEVRPGDKWQRDKLSAENKERSEIVVGGHFGPDEDVQIDFSMRIEKGAPSKAVWVVLGQIHTTPPNGEHRTPPVSQQLKGQKFYVIAEHELEDGSIAKERLAIDPDMKRGIWHRFRYQARFSTGPSGYLVIWRDGKKVADYRGALGYRSEGGLYFKIGIYRHASSDRLAVSYKDVEISRLGGRGRH